MTVAAIRSRLTDLVRQWTPVPDTVLETVPGDTGKESVPGDTGNEPGHEPRHDVAGDAPVPEVPESGAVRRPRVSASLPAAGQPWWAGVSLARVPVGRVRALGLGLAALLLVVGWWWWQGRPQPVIGAPQVVTEGTGVVGGQQGASSEAGAGPAGLAGGMLIVHVTGPVRHPGIVEVPITARVIDAIEAAGGLRRGAVYGAVNLARPLIDGEQIVVGIEASTAAAGGPPGRVSLNQATAADLEELPGVGPVLAARIIDWRMRNGGFRSVDELREVSGIGDATFADLSPLLTAP